jgi:hypothetical protein
MYLDVYRADLHFKVLSEYPQLDGSSPCILRLDPRAVVFWFLLQHDFGVEFWVGANGLGDYGAQFHYHFVVGREDCVGEGAEETRVVIWHHSQDCRAP